MVLILLLEYFIACFWNHANWNIPQYYSLSPLALGMRLTTGNLVLKCIPSKTLSSWEQRLSYWLLRSHLFLCSFLSIFMCCAICQSMYFYIYVLCYLSKYVFLSRYGQDGPGFPTYHTSLSVWYQEQIHAYTQPIISHFLATLIDSRTDIYCNHRQRNSIPRLW